MFENKIVMFEVNNNNYTCHHIIPGVNKTDLFGQKYHL